MNVCICKRKQVLIFTYFRNIFEKNGSAIDATIAAMFCNGVVTMQSMGLGGGFLMTIYNRSERKAYFLNAREKAPLAARDEIYKKSANISQHGNSNRLALVFIFIVCLNSL